MKHQRVTLKTLRASAQPRPLVTADVDKLAASIKEIGLIQPITVRAVTVINGIAENGFQIVAGHHRVAACRALGWDEIDAIVIVAAEHLQAELIEIDENLCRSELTASQRSSFTKRRKEIWEALYPAAKTEILGGASCATQKATEHKDRPQNQPQFAATTAAITGESKSQINRHIARAEALGDDLPRVHGTSLDKGVELDALAKLPEAERAELIERAQAGEKVSARPAKALELVAPADPTTIGAFASVMGRALADVRKVMQCNSNKEVAKKLATAAHSADPVLLCDLDLLLTDLLELGEVGLRREELS